MRPRLKVWLEGDDGTPLLGPGMLRLLLAVEQTHSLKAAAAEVGVSYRKAWNQLQRAEAALGFSLLERQAGGEGGGGSRLTPRAQRLIKQFLDMKEVLEQRLEDLFQQYVL